MVLDWLRRLAGVREKPDPRELLGLVGAVEGQGQQGGAPPFDLYTLLEDEKIPRELWPLVLGFIVRDVKLTYFEPRDIEYLFWKIEAHVARLRMMFSSVAPHPSRFASVEEYVRATESLRLLPDNLRVMMMAAVRRSTLGFERRLQAMRHFVVSYGSGGRW